MTILDRLFESRSLERPTTPLNFDNLSAVLGGSLSATGKVVTTTNALQLVAVYACIRLLSETFGSLPAILYKRLSEGKERATNHPLYFVLHDVANPEMTSFELRSTMMAHVLLWGHTYAEISRDAAGNVKSLWPLTPNRVTPYRNSRNELVYQINLPDKTVANLSARRILHVSAMLGLSPIGQAKEALGLTMSAEEYGARFFANDSRPGGVLEHPGHLSKEAAERLRTSFESYHAGLANRHRVAVLEEGLKWQQIGLDPGDSQFLETRKFQVSEIARLYGVPPHMIGDTEKSTSWGTGIEQQNIGFVTYSLRSWLTRWEQEINKTLLTQDERKNYFMEFLVDGLLRGDYKTRQEGLAIQRQNGIINTDEWREKENMNPLPNGKGKVYLLNAAMKTIDQIIDGPQKPESPATPQPEEEPEQEPTEGEEMENENE